MRLFLSPVLPWNFVKFWATGCFEGAATQYLGDHPHILMSGPYFDPKEADPSLSQHPSIIIDTGWCLVIHLDSKFFRLSLPSVPLHLKCWPKKHPNFHSININYGIIDTHSILMKQLMFNLPYLIDSHFYVK